jgi:hypothetical protein
MAECQHGAVLALGSNRRCQLLLRMAGNVAHRFYPARNHVDIRLLLLQKLPRGPLVREVARQRHSMTLQVAYL